MVQKGTDFDIKLEPTAFPHVQIEKRFKQLIQTGALSKGQKIPSLRKLADQWGVNFKTVQRAMRHLKEEGIVGGGPRFGMFVKNEIDQAIIGVLFIFSPRLTDEVARFQRAIFESLMTEAEFFDLQKNWTCRAYDGLGNRQINDSLKQSPSYRHFLDDLKNYPFKGFVQIHGSFGEDEYSRLCTGLPTVRFGSPHDSRADVILDYESFGHDAIRFMAGKGCRRIFYFRTMDDTTCDALDLQGIRRAEREAGLPPVEIHQFVYPADLNDLPLVAYESMIRLLDQWEKSGQWPDALLVSDDIVMSGMAPALIRRRIPWQRSLRTLTMANEGIFHDYGIPIDRYEFSPCDIARNLTRILKSRLNNETADKWPVKVRGKAVECAG
ncbi:MAG: GntR family transcriptional regulator [Verrucomicrobiae bacterium]|nr:GntR family transcriptional regulator [Verrucomicrobiae bacterium]